jgi:AbrB family looped-hinge helix DNA binding protein
MPTSTLTSKGQITLPKAVREHLDLAAGDEVDFMIDGDGVVRLAARRRPAADLYGLIHRADDSPPPTVYEMDEAIAEVVAEDDRRIGGKK